MKFPKENKKISNKIKQLNKFSSMINKSSEIWEGQIKTVCCPIDETKKITKNYSLNENENVFKNNLEKAKVGSLFKVIKPEFVSQNQGLVENEKEKENRKISFCFNLGNWTSEEDEQLLYLKNILKLKTWVSIKQFFETKNSKQCAYRYKKLTQNKKINWSKEEDIILVNLINTHGENFEYLRVFFPEKSVIDIKKRYYSKLYHRRFSFTPEEDNSIVNLYLNMEISEEEQMNIRNKFPESLKKRLKILLTIRKEKNSDLCINNIESLKSIVNISSRIQEFNKSNKRKYCEDMDDDDLHLKKMNYIKNNNYNYNDCNEDIVSQIFSNTVITSSDSNENDQNYPFLYKKYEFERMFQENQTICSENNDFKNLSSTMRNSNKFEYSNTSILSMTQSNLNLINISNPEEDGCCIYKNNNLYINNETNQLNNSKFIHNPFLSSKFLKDNQKDIEKSLSSQFNSTKTEELIMKKENLKELLRQINSLSSIFCEGFEKKVWMSLLSNDQKISLIGKYMFVHKRINCIFEENERLSLKTIENENEFVEFLNCKIEFINELIILEKNRLSLLEGLYCD